MNGYQITDSNTAPWRKSTMAEGVEVKDLGKANGREMQLVRFAPGTSFPLHVHGGPEFIFLLEGEVCDQGQLLRPGWAVVAASGTTHEGFHSPSGCLFLTVYSE